MLLVILSWRLKIFGKNKDHSSLSSVLLRLQSKQESSKRVLVQFTPHDQPRIRWEHDNGKSQ